MSDIDVPIGDFALRLASVMPEGRGSQARIADQADISTTAMSKYVRGGALPELPAAARLARVLGINLYWLATGDGSPSAESAGHIGIPIYDVRLAAGAASFAQGAQIVGEMPFDRDLIRGFGRAETSDLAVVQAEGDSMEPLIADGARVVLDLKDVRLREGIFAFRLGDELRIKRLRRTVEGVEIMSENPRYEPELLQGDVLEQFALIGRAVWSGSML